MSRAARPLAVLLLPALSGCATLRAPVRAPVPVPLPLTAGVCPGPFNDYGGEGRQLLETIRERQLFRTVVPLSAQGGRADLALVPHIGAPEPRMGIGLATVVPWALTATFFPWIVQASDPVQITAVPARAGVVACGSSGIMPAGGGSASVVVQDTTRRTTSMAGWTSLLLLLHPRWQSGQVYEFRPAVDALVARRAELLELARGSGGG